MRILVTLALCGSLAVLGCSSGDDDNTGGSGGSGGSAGTGGSGGSAGSAGSGGMAGMGGSGGAGAKSFCEDYDSICGFGGGGYADQNACETAYEGFAGPKQDCVELHIGLADGGDTGLHCPHANGEGPCDL